MDVRFYDDPAGFLEAAAPLLTADPVRASVVGTTAQRAAATGARGTTGPWWFATIAGDGRVLGAAMRTHPTPPHPAFALTMPEAAATALADALDARGETLPGCNGDLAAAGLLAQRAADRAGGRVEVGMHTRLFEARTVRPPRVPSGALRPAGPDDADLVLRWNRAFHDDADLQAGREPRRPDVDPAQALAAVRRSIAEEKMWLWEDRGRVVHMTGINPPAFGVRRIGPVYTPEEFRGHGYAGHVVALLTRRALDAGHRVCLYTDQANPVSNALYERIGYEASGDEAEYVVVDRP